MCVNNRNNDEINYRGNRSFQEHILITSVYKFLTNWHVQPLLEGSERVCIILLVLPHKLCYTWC